MINHQELVISVSDAEALALMLGERYRVNVQEGQPADTLAELLAEARKLPPGECPADVVAMNSKVVYEEHPGGKCRHVVLSYPVDADVAKGRISVLSPIGLALLGRSPGATVVPEMPGGRGLTIRILESGTPVT